MELNFQRHKSDLGCCFEPKVKFSSTQIPQGQVTRWHSLKALSVHPPLRTLHLSHKEISGTPFPSTTFEFPQTLLPSTTHAALPYGRDMRRARSCTCPSFSAHWQQ